MDVLKVHHIAETYQSKSGETRAIDDISFTLKRGEFLTVVGPSGCGKSTLLSIIAGIVTPTEGEVYINDRKVCGITPSVGYMLQDDNLLSWRSIMDNVMLGLEIQKKVNDSTRERALRLLHTYGLSEFINAFPSQLSGGMRQRVALIRTLATSPDILLLDEAFSALDYQTRLEVTEDVYKILKSEGVTTVMVTHDIPEGISMGDKIMVLTSRPAKIRDIIEVDFGEGRTPMTTRKSPLFSVYFDRIWKELTNDEQPRKVP